jgi:hypothetical protein
MPAPHPLLPPDQLPTAAPARFFAAFGLGGRSGVYSNFQMAVSMVGISIVEYKDMDQAMAAVLKWREHNATIATQLNSNPPSVTHPTIHGTTVPSMVGLGGMVPERPRSVVPGPGDEGFFPPAKLMGPDPSKERDKFYGVEVGSEMALQRAMAPADVDEEVARDLASAMLDSVAVPGTSSVSSGGDVDQQMTDLG